MYIYSAMRQASINFKNLSRNEVFSINEIHSWNQPHQLSKTEVT